MLILFELNKFWYKKRGWAYVGLKMVEEYVDDSLLSIKFSCIWSAKAIGKR